MFLSIICILLITCSNSFAVVYTVNALTDAGTGAGANGDLRYCITQANLVAGSHTINFSVAGTITLTSTLPVFTKQISVQGNTAPGYAVATPTIQLNGNGAAAWIFLFNNATGANSLLQGLVMNRATLTNVESVGVSSLTIRECFIGTNLAGTASAGANPAYGIQLGTSSNNIILNNVISGHTTHGLFIHDNSNTNTIRGNKIGCNLLGTVAIPNAFHGILINVNSINNIIGGAAAIDRNIISGNTYIGVSVNGTSTGVQITNNYIGTNLAGTAALPNAEHGIMINTSANATITNNVVSGNGYFGIHILNANGHTVRGNKVGVNAAGTAAIANTTIGLRFELSDNAIIGGATAGQENILSGNLEEGLFMINCASPTIYGNYMGTDLTGTIGIANGRHGMHLISCSTPIIGGATAGQRNISSGNTWDGIFIDNCANATVYGNFVGTNITGTAALGNGQAGIHVDNCTTPIIGGAAAGQKNTTSANGWDGILIYNSPSASIKGNVIGTNTAGTAAFPNLSTGMHMVNCNDALIGGPLAGELNVFSGNASDGIRFENSLRATIQGNFIGTNITGTAALGNGGHGIACYSNSTDHLIGGTTAATRNIISANNADGIHYVGDVTGSPNNLLIKNNYIGTDVNGAGPATTFGNGEGGVLVTINCLGLIIGGTTVAERNIISGNGRVVPGNGNGIFIYKCPSPQIRGNYIGLELNGTTAMGNAQHGIFLWGTNNAIIGGNTAATRNLISSNAYHGININNDFPALTSGIIITGNYIGTDVTGTLARGNGQSGIIALWCRNCFFGRANANEGNLLSNNAELGIHIIGGDGNTMYQNLIGVASNGTTAMGNKNGGIFIQGVGFSGGSGLGGSNNIVGGLAALQPNTIAYSTGTGANPAIGNGFGIGVAHTDQGINNTFIGNKIFCNAGLGIDLNFAAAFGGTNNGLGNGGKSAPAVTAISSTVTSGTGVNGETIHLYNNVTCVTCQGEIYLGTTVVAGGTWSITHISVTTPSSNSATATNGTLGTSQFSCHITLPVHIVSFAVAAQGSSALLTWTTAWEQNNKMFVIERSKDGNTFEAIGSITGHGSTGQLSNYTFTDTNPLDGVSYYRLRQVDFNGMVSYSSIESVVFGGNSSIQLFPNPATNYLNVLVNNTNEEKITINVYSTLGVALQNLNIEKTDNAYRIELSGVASGSYILEVKSPSTHLTKTFLVY